MNRTWSLQVPEIRAAAGEDVGPWPEAAKAKKGPSDEEIKTDQNGRFRVTCLLTGLQFRLDVDASELVFGDGLRSGQTKELGDVRMTVEKE